MKKRFEILVRVSYDIDVVSDDEENLEGLCEVHRKSFTEDPNRFINDILDDIDYDGDVEVFCAPVEPDPQPEATIYPFATTYPFSDDSKSDDSNSSWSTGTTWAVQPSVVSGTITLTNDPIFKAPVWHGEAPPTGYSTTWSTTGTLTVKELNDAVDKITGVEQHIDASDGICQSEDCTESTLDGEGWDGYCGSCADRMELLGVWDEHE